jgi:NADPH:quinone reductase-like Zn-dependent oxidoreductase
MPKIVRFHQLGGPEKLKLEEAPERALAAGEVRLRVKAMGLNRAEALFVRGYYMDKPTLPSRIGYEAAGIVEAVGPGVDAGWIGKHVATIPSFRMSQYGVIGEEAVVPVEALGEYPSELSPIQAAAIWMQYLTAYGALVTIGKIQPSDFVIITAASSSVGLAAIQIVKAEGARSIAATRTADKRDELIQLGADHVIITDTEDLPQRVHEITRGKGSRLIFDAVAGPAIEKLALAAAYEGIIIEYGNLALQPTPFPLLTAFGKGLTVRAYTLHEITPFPDRLEPAKAYAIDRLKDGRFVPKIARTFPLTQISEAFHYMESNAQVGKVIVTVD